MYWGRSANVHPLRPKRNDRGASTQSRRTVMSFARHGAMANLESTLARRHAQMAGESSRPGAVEFVTSQPGAVAHNDDDLQYMRSSFHSVRDSLLGVSRPKAAESTVRAASDQRRPPPRAADRVPDYSVLRGLAYPASRPARELSLLVEPDQVVMCQTCSWHICMCTVDSLHKGIPTRAPTRCRAMPSTFSRRPPMPRPEPPRSTPPTPPEPRPAPACIARSPPPSAPPMPPEPTPTGRAPPPSGGPRRARVPPPPKPTRIGRVPRRSAQPTAREPPPELALIARATAPPRTCTTPSLPRRARAPAPGRPPRAGRLRPAARPTSSRSGRLAIAHPPRPLPP